LTVFHTIKLRSFAQSCFQTDWSLRPLRGGLQQTLQSGKFRIE